MFGSASAISFSPSISASVSVRSSSSEMFSVAPVTEILFFSVSLPPKAFSASSVPARLILTGMVLIPDTQYPKAGVPMVSTSRAISVFTLHIFTSTCTIPSVSTAPLLSLNSSVLNLSCISAPFLSYTLRAAVSVTSEFRPPTFTGATT